MSMKKLGKKLIALIIVFSMIFLDSMPILSNVVLAAEDPNNFVEVIGYFSGEGIENTSSLDCDIDIESLAINFEVSVKNKGYLRNVIWKLDDNLNFTIKEDSEVEIKNNQIKLKDVNLGETQIISIPIEFTRQAIYASDYLSNINKITFSGTYVDNDGDEHKIEKTLDLKLSWKEDTSTNVEITLTKNIEYENGGKFNRILQSVIRVYGNEQNNLPIKSTTITMDIPKIDGMEITGVNVEADKLSFTQGREDSDINFDDVNYDVSENVLVINTDNNEKDGEIFNSYSEDVYVVTFLYVGENNSKEIVSGNAEIVLKNYAGNEETVNTEFSYDLNNAVGDLVHYYREDKVNDISKGYLMADSENEKYEISYTKKDVLNVSRADLIYALEIADSDEYFTTTEGDKVYYTENMSTYKSTEFSKENLVSILGEDGKVQVLNMNDEVITEIALNSDPDENGNYVVSYDEPVSKIKILISSPIADGNISILSTKIITKLDYSRDIVRSFDKLVNVGEGFVDYGEGNVVNLGKEESVIEFNPTTSMATLEMEQTEFSTIVTNEGINFQIRLNNNDDTSDLFVNPVFEIRLPSGIRETNIRNIDLFYANGELEIANVETLIDGDNKVIRITLNGSQTSYNLNKESNGTVISLDVDLIVDEFIGNVSETVELYYYNEDSVNYKNETEWGMLLNSENIEYARNGYDVNVISYRGPEELITGQASETKNDEEEDENRISSAKQDAGTDLIEEGAEAKLATMYISVVNNTDRSFSDFRFLGRIPFAGNKDITTGEDLGTTVDTILSSEIISDDDINYVVYYSENGDANDDLEDENNGWRTDFYKTGGVKSYLIVIDSDYVLEPSDSLEFSYDYMIPANLKAGDAFYGTYATYYKEVGSEVDSNSTPNKIGYETTKTAALEVSADFINEEIKEFSDAEFEVKLVNDSNNDAGNINVTINIPSILYVKNVVGADFNGYVVDKVVDFNVPLVEAKSEESVIVKFGVGDTAVNEGNFTISTQVSGDNISTIDLMTEEYEVKETKVSYNDNVFNGEILVEEEYENYYSISNVDDQTYYNVKIIKKFEKPIRVVKTNVRSILDVKEDVNHETGEVVWTIEEFNPGDYFSVDYYFTIDFVDNGRAMDEASIQTVCDLNDGSEAMVSEDKVIYYQPVLSVEKLNSTDVSYSDAGENVEYEYRIINNSKYSLLGLTINDSVSENAMLNYIKVVIDGEERYYTFRDFEGMVSSIYIPEGTDIYVLVNVIIDEDAKGFVHNSLSVFERDAWKENVDSYTKLEDVENFNGYEIVGAVYIDSNKNQQFDANEESLSGEIVSLYDSETNECVGSAITDIAGRYTFDGLENKIYYVKFNYDDTEYVLSKGTDGGFSQNETSVINVKNNYITDNIAIEDKSVANIDLGLTRDNIFDLKLDATVEKMTVQNNAESNDFVSENKKLSKVDIDPKLVSGTKVLIEYKVEIKNQGTIAGTVNKIIDYLPAGMDFESSLNPGWYLGSDGNLYNRSLSDEVINPGESKEVRLILAKNMTENNTGLIHNSFEIADAINDRGVVDIDSSPGNQLDEDDLSYADSIIGITTGLSIGVLPIVLVIGVLVIPIAIVVWKIVDKRRYV